MQGTGEWVRAPGHCQTLLRGLMNLDLEFVCIRCVYSHRMSGICSVLQRSVCALQRS